MRLVTRIHSPTFFYTRLDLFTDSSVFLQQNLSHADNLFHEICAELFYLSEYSNFLILIILMKRRWWS